MLDYSTDMTVRRNTKKKSNRKDIERMNECLPLAYLDEMEWY